MCWRAMHINSCGTTPPIVPPACKPSPFTPAPALQFNNLHRTQGSRRVRMQHFRPQSGGTNATHPPARGEGGTNATLPPSGGMGTKAILPGYERLRGGGTLIDLLRVVLYHGRLLESFTESKGHRLLTGMPGVYFHPDKTFQKADGYPVVIISWKCSSSIDTSK